VDDLARLEAVLDAGGRKTGSLELIGRRELRSNNSWMHNSVRLVKGKRRCTLRVSPTDAKARGIPHGAMVTVTSRVGSVVVAAEISDEMMPGVVSLPHGYGHGRSGTRLGVANGQAAGVSVNDLTDETRVDPLSGNASFSGVEVEVAAVTATRTDDEARGAAGE
jgi:anaerobic selenocysteine-containing dehydrogenase